MKHRTSLPDTNQKTKISVCTLSYQGVEVVVTCLKSILRQRGDFELEVFVTDNGSTDGTAEMISAEFPEVDLTVFPENRSFTTAYNHMLRKATGDYVFIVSNDIELRGERFFELALEIFRQNPEIGMLAPQSIRPDGELDGICKSEQSFSDLMYSWTFLAPLFYRIYRKNGMQTILSQECSRFAEVLQDSSVLVKKEAMGQHTLYDEDFNFYYTEDEISVCMRRRGWKIYYTADIQVRHHHQYSTKKINKIKIQWIYLRDALTYAKKFCGRYRTSLLLAPLSYLTFLTRALYWYVTDKATWR